MINLYLLSVEKLISENRVLKIENINRPNFDYNAVYQSLADDTWIEIEYY